MATLLDQSCISCNISYLDNQSKCTKAECPFVSTKTTKRRYHLFKRSQKNKAKSTYLNLNELDDSDYPFATTDNTLLSTEDSSCSDWSLSTINSLSSSISYVPDNTIISIDNSHQSIKKITLRRFHTKVSPV